MGSSESSGEAVFPDDWELKPMDEMPFTVWAESIPDHSFSHKSKLRTKDWAGVLLYAEFGPVRSDSKSLLNAFGHTGIRYKNFCAPRDQSAIALLNVLKKDKVPIVTEGRISFWRSGRT